MKILPQTEREWKEFREAAERFGRELGLAIRKWQKRKKKPA